MNSLQFTKNATIVLNTTTEFKDIRWVLDAIVFQALTKVFSETKTNKTLSCRLVYFLKANFIENKIKYFRHPLWEKKWYKLRVWLGDRNTVTVKNRIFLSFA